MDCGPLTVNFFNDDVAKSALDASIFADIRETGAYKFRNLYTEDTTKKGSYPIKFSAYYTNYSSNEITLTTPFIITIVDPCDVPSSVAAPSL